MPHHLRIFLASPGDVADERALAVKVLSRLPRDPLLVGKVTLEAVAWDYPGAKTPFLAGEPAQDSVTRSLGKPSECDIVVVILWSRLGSPINQAPYAKPEGNGFYSGTEWEYEEAWQSHHQHGKPRILLYHRINDPVARLNPANKKAILKQLDQMKRVQAFLAACHERDGSIPNEYERPSEFEELLERHLKEQIRNILEFQETLPSVSPDSALPRWEGWPFPGLRTFTDKDAPIFFGRGRETDDLVSKFADSAIRFVTIVGASGSGKSSLVWAGLIPRLKASAIEGSQDWEWIRFTPGEVGDNPFMALAIGFKPTLEKHSKAPREVASELQKDTEALQRWTQRTLEGKPDRTKLLLFIDQFEELLTRVIPDYQDAFIDLLARAADLERLRIVVTIRADFYHRWIEWPLVRERLDRKQLETGHFPLLAPGLGQLQEMITRPAEQAGLSFEAGLPARILNDTKTEPGALALMAFALAELYEAKTADGQLTHAAYESFEGVPGAIGKRADNTFGHLEKRIQAKLGDVFRELVEVDERGVATRRRARLHQVTTSPEAQTLVNALTDARLLVTGRGEANESTVEVAHEALFRSWPRLKKWIQDTADDLRLRRQITQLAAYWKEHGCDDRHRWPDDRVEEAVAMVQHLGLRPEDFTDEERAFLGPLDREGMLAKLNDPATSHEQRDIIGVRLSLLGDPRPGVGLREDKSPDIVWCPVPGGEVTLEENAGTFRVEPFYIAKYPVTCAQYRAFLEAEDGYTNPEWWEDLWFQVDQPGRQFNRRDNHPAENLCWLEAVAFCHWLSNKLDYEIRLPTEWEWQQAATGGNPENQYPWGPEWDNNRANTIESELSCSTAVGMYPQGASPVDALDMAGNILEWCLDEFTNPNDVKLSTDARRVVRGGSWAVVPANARVAFRLRGDPDLRNGEVGFRVACLAPILNH